MLKSIVYIGLHKCFLLLLLGVVTSCQSGALAPKGYVEWVRGHHADLSNTVSIGNITASLSYLPADWLAINEAGSERPAQIITASKEYEGMEYYRLRLALQSGHGDILQYNAGSTDEYYQRVEYFSFGLQSDLRLLVSNDTLTCKLFHFERNYGAAPYADFMLGFDENLGNKSNRTLIYEDRVYSKSLIKLTIPAENIQRIPTLKL